MRPTNSPTEVIGPAILGGIAEAILLGLMLCELFTFFAKPTNNRLFRLIVYWVNIVALTQTFITAYNWWSMLVLGFGDANILLSYTWPSQIQPALNSLMSGPVHGYFIYRCFISANRNWVLTIPLAFCAAVSVINAILTTIGTFYFVAHHRIADAVSTNLDRTFDVWLTSTAVLDACITAILLNYLIRSRHQTASRYLTTLIDRLIALVWQSALPPCFCAIAMSIVSATATARGARTYWFFLPGALLGKLYCLSLMVTLNSNASIARCLDVTDPHASTTLPGVMFDLRTGFQRPELTERSHGTEDIHNSSSISSAPKSVNGEIGERDILAADSSTRTTIDPHQSIMEHV